MSREVRNKYYRERDDYRNYEKHRASKRSPIRDGKRRSRSPRKGGKEIDETILREISKLPEPNELWDSQFRENSYPSAPPAPSFGQEQAYAGIYDDFGTMSAVPPAPQPPEIVWNQLSLPPPPVSSTFTSSNMEDQIKKEAAIESEVRHQKATLSKQREDYIKKSGILKKELETLKDQRNELRGDSKRSPSPETKRFLKENTKLQLEIQNKLKTINNVVDMLNGIIGEEAHEHRDSDDSSERGTKRRSRSPATKKFNYVYYDPEMHWCRICNEFPPTAKDYLNHLHSASHQKMAAAHMEAPWHTVTGLNEGFPNYPAAVTKRTPIRGLQFFVPSTAWYCKLCDQFIGDLHCASAHLKSVGHSKNYSNFVEQNPHWETDWMSDRQKAFEKVRMCKTKPEEKPIYTGHTITFNKDGFHTKKKKSISPATDEKKDKKKKKERRIKKRKKSSSSSSQSDSSSSDSDSGKKKKAKIKKEKHKPESSATMLNKWVSVLQGDHISDKDKKLLNTLKNRIKDDQLKREEERRDSSERGSTRERERDRERALLEQQRKNREGEPRDERSKEKRRNSKGSPSHAGAEKGDKKPEFRKMPFIGKMPVYKSLGKTTKPEEQKKEDDNKKKEEDEAAKKKREEMDAEIQKKVAEFKEKIARAQLEREMMPRLDIAPPGVVIPTELGVAPPVMPQPQPAPAPAPVRPQAPSLPQQPPANLSKDFQEALDIIFPSDVKKDHSQEQAAYPPMTQGFVPQMSAVMPPFPPMGHMPPMNPQMMMGFDMNAPMFPPRPQLYDSHVPMAPRAPGPTPTKRPQNQPKEITAQPIATGPLTSTQRSTANNKKENGEVSKKQAELDELALLGIDATDVGAGI